MPTQTLFFSHKSMNPNQEPKYKIEDGKLVNRQSGEAIPDDEPVFILRARDIMAVETLSRYHSRIMDNEHARAVHFRIEQFERFAKAHPERMKSPDTQLTTDWEALT